MGDRRCLRFAGTDRWRGPRGALARQPERKFARDAQAGRNPGGSRAAVPCRRHLPDPELPHRRLLHDRDRRGRSRNPALESSGRRRIPGRRLELHQHLWRCGRGVSGARVPRCIAIDDVQIAVLEQGVGHGVEHFRTHLGGSSGWVVSTMRTFLRQSRSCSNSVPGPRLRSACSKKPVIVLSSLGGSRLRG